MERLPAIAFVCFIFSLGVFCWVYVQGMSPVSSLLAGLGAWILTTAACMLITTPNDY